MISIRRRLIILLLSIIIVIGSITVLLSYKDAHHEVGELFDAQLAQSARVLDALILHQINKLNISAEDLKNIQNIINHITLLDDPGNSEFDSNNEEREAQEYERKIAFQIWDKGNLILRSASSPDTPLSSISLNKQLVGYFNEEIKSNLWRVFSVRTQNGKYFMQIGEQLDVRNELTEDISKQLIKTSLLSLPILAVLIWIAISKGLSPLERVATEVSKRNKENFKSLSLNDIPLEINPLIVSINNLLSRLQSSFEKEQRFTDSAAHELRTPLAALKTQAQVAIAADNDIDKKHALEQIVQGVDRAGHLINQILVIARLDKIVLNDDSIKIYDFVHELTGQFYNQLTSKSLTISIDGTKDAIIRSNKANLTILLNNILDNAIRYSSDNSEIKIRINNIKNIKTELTIVNYGLTIPEDDLAKVFDRFYRVPGTNTIGCGLGLAIAKQISDIQNIGLFIENTDTHDGVIVRLIWRH